MILVASERGYGSDLSSGRVSHSSWSVCTLASIALVPTGDWRAWLTATREGTAPSTSTSLTLTVLHVYTSTSLTFTSVASTCLSRFNLLTHPQKVLWTAHLWWDLAGKLMAIWDWINVHTGQFIWGEENRLGCDFDQWLLRAALTQVECNLPATPLFSFDNLTSDTNTTVTS